jgi:hypothetical protein
LNSAIRAEKRALIARIQTDYNIIASGIIIQKQLNGKLSGDNNNNDKDDNDVSEIIIISLKFVERRRLTETLLRDLSIFAIEKDYRQYIDLCKNIIAFCKRKERRRSKIYRSREKLFVKTVDNLKEEKRSDSLKCKGFQYLFCLAYHDLALKDKQKIYVNKFFFQRYIDRYRLNKFKTDENVPYLDNFTCDKIILEHKIYFKNYTILIYNFVL